MFIIITVLLHSVRQSHVIQDSDGLEKRTLVTHHHNTRKQNDFVMTIS